MAEDMHVITSILFQLQFHKKYEKNILKNADSRKTEPRLKQKPVAKDQ